MTAPIFGALLLAAALGWACFALATSGRAARRAERTNLLRGLPPATDGAAVRESAFLRLGRALTPPAYLARLERQHALAGRPRDWSMERVLAAKPLFAATGGAAGLLIGANAEHPLLKLLAVALVAFGYFIPDLMLVSKGQERQKAIQLELPNTLDQMLISVEAGLGFEAAMARAAGNGKGPMAEEMTRTLQDMRVGRSRRESYKALAERSSVPELRSFVQAVVQADAYGIAIGSVLRVQAKVMRVKRRQRAEEKAMKLPVAVLFPLLFFIFPVLFIAILGPAVISSIQSLSGG